MTAFSWDKALKPLNLGGSIRLIGSLIMVHSDDQGLVLPPKLAPHQLVFIPVGPWDKDPAIMETIQKLDQDLQQQGIRTVIDDSDKRPGNKFNEWELRGACIRIELGPRDLENQQVVMMTRDSDEKVAIPLDQVQDWVLEELEAMQGRLFDRAKAWTDARSHYHINSLDELKAHINQCQADNVPAGFVLAGWDGDPETEKQIQEETGFTTRNIPFEGQVQAKDTCIVTGKPAKETVWLARAY